MMKKHFEAPSVSRLGTVAELTLQGGPLNHTDVPHGTPSNGDPTNVMS
jgi:hypothetical protein